jgi:hypothetical protein
LARRSSKRRHQEADQSYLEKEIGLFEMPRSTQRLFENEQPLEKTPPLEFRTIELVVEGWHASRNVQATV